MIMMLFWMKDIMMIKPLMHILSARAIFISVLIMRLSLRQSMVVQILVLLVCEIIEMIHMRVMKE